MLEKPTHNTEQVGAMDIATVVVVSAVGFCVMVGAGIVERVLDSRPVGFLRQEAALARDTFGNKRTGPPNL